MAFFDKYPYTDFHEMNLDWLLNKMRELEIEFDEFKVVNNITFSGQWDITKQYPAWTIVSDNNIGYVSQKPVPAGVPLSNGNYWVEVIDYTAQIAGLENRVIALENTVGDSSSGLVKDVDDLQADMTNAQNDITSIMHNKYHKYAIIADSYGSTTSSDDNTSIITHFMANMGLTENVDIAYKVQGGAGFVSDGVRLFSTLLTNLYNDINSSLVAFNPADLTDLIVVGGDNDNGSGYSTIYSAISSFVTAAKSYFPNATIHIGEVGNTGLSKANIHYLIATNVITAYRDSVNLGCHYLSGVEHVMYNLDYFMPDDTHPTGVGMNAIACAMQQALISEFNPQWLDQVTLDLSTNNMSSTSTNITANIVRNASNVIITLTGSIDNPNGSLSRNVNYCLGAIKSKLIIGNNIYNFNEVKIEVGSGNWIMANIIIQNQNVYLIVPQNITAANIYFTRQRLMFDAVIS